MASIGCRAGHPVRGPSLEEAIELGSWAPLEQMERKAKRCGLLQQAQPTTPRPSQTLATPVRWEGRSPMASPMSVPSQPQAHLLFGRTHTSRPEQPSPRESSQAARGYSMRSGRSWTPIMQRHQHLDSWEPAARTSTRHVSKMADVSEKFHKKPIGDNNTRRFNARAALLRMLVNESKAACEPPSDPREKMRRRLQRREARAEANRWKLQPQHQATYEQEYAAAVNKSAVLMNTRELAASWAANDSNVSSSTGWSQGFAASARGRSNIYAHRDATRNQSLTERASRAAYIEGDSALQPTVGTIGRLSHNGMPHPPNRDATLSLAAQAEAQVMRQLVGNAAV